MDTVQYTSQTVDTFLYTSLYLLKGDMPESQGRTKVALLRKAIGLSAKDFAKLIGRSIDTIRSLESGRLALSRRLAAQLSYRTGVPMSWFLDKSIKGPPVDIAGFELTPQIFEFHAAEMAASAPIGEGFARAVLIARMESILAEAEKLPNFDLCAHRVFDFLDRLQSEFLPHWERPKSSEPMQQFKLLSQLKKSKSKKKRP